MITDKGVARLQRALDHITDHPEEWDQGAWLKWINADGLTTDSWDEVSSGGCGTACCLAGRIVLNEPGVEFVRAAPYREYSYADGDRVRYQDRVWVVSELAISLLTDDTVYGSSRSNFQNLFSGVNTLEDLWQISQEMTGRRLIVPKEYNYAD